MISLEDSKGFFLQVSFPVENIKCFCDYIDKVNGEGASQKDLLVRGVVNTHAYLFLLGKKEELAGNETNALIYFDNMFLLPGFMQMLSLKWLFGWSAKKGLLKNVPGVVVKKVRDRVGALFIIKKFRVLEEQIETLKAEVEGEPLGCD